MGCFSEKQMMGGSNRAMFFVLLCVPHLMGAMGAGSCAIPPCQSPKVVVSLTSIPARLPYLHPVLRSIKQQSYPPDEIILGLPKFSRREDTPYIVPDYIKEDPDIRVVWSEKDYGPATKLLNALSVIDDDTYVVTVDDDGHLGRDDVRILLEASLQFPGTAIGFTGWNVSCILDRSKCFKEWNTYHFIRQGRSFACSDEFVKPYGRHHCAAGVKSHDHPEPTDVIEGYKNALYRKSLFKPSIFDIFQAPEAMLSVDDVWISGMLAGNGIPRLVVLDEKRPWQRLEKPSAKKYHEVPRPAVEKNLDSVKALHGEHGFVEKNHNMVKYFHELGVW